MSIYLSLHRILPFHGSCENGSWQARCGALNKGFLEGRVLPQRRHGSLCLRRDAELRWRVLSALRRKHKSQHKGSGNAFVWRGGTQVSVRRPASLQVSLSSFAGESEWERKGFSLNSGSWWDLRTRKSHPTQLLPLLAISWRCFGKNFYRKDLGCSPFLPIRPLPFTLPEPHRWQFYFLSSYTLFFFLLSSFFLVSLTPLPQSPRFSND